MKSEKGFSLVEVLIAIAILGMISAAFVGALFTAGNILRITDERETAKNLAGAQLEHVFKLPFRDDGVYSENTTITAQYPGFVLIDYLNGTANNKIRGENVTDNSANITLQRITVVVQRNSNNYTLQGYKVEDE